METRLAGLILLLFSATAPAQTQSGKTELEPMVVKPKADPLNEMLDTNMERLRKDITGCVRCPPLIEVDRESIYDKTYYGVGAVLSFFSGFPEKPPQISPERRAELRIVHDWRMYERDPDR